MKKKLVSLLLLPLIPALASCGSIPGAGAGGSGAGASCDPNHVVVGVGPYIDVAPTYLGIQQGFFKKHGLTVQPKVISGGGATLLPSVIKGELDFAYGNLVSLLVAREQGLDVQAVAHGSSSPGKGSEQGALLVANGSPIKDASDLEGKTVAVNSLESLTEVMVRDAVSKKGGDGSKVKMVEMSLSDMPAALSSHQVDAIATYEPFTTIGKKAGAKPIYHLFDITGDGETLIATYFTGGQFAKTCPKVVSDFTKAMNESLDYAQSHPDQVRSITKNYLDLNASVRNAMALPKFGSELDRGDAQEVGDIVHKYGLLKKKPQIGELLSGEKQ